jgi:adenosylcobyric acid synthase
MKTALMVWGASSGAGKSLLATALCRWAARQGIDVAPFKAQNMSNNARVVPLAPTSARASRASSDDAHAATPGAGRVAADARWRDDAHAASLLPDLCGDADEGLGEIGSAQYFQALAARVPPHVDMNPVLLKPERDTASQVVLHGRVDAALSRLPWRERSAALARRPRSTSRRRTT